MIRFLTTLALGLCLAIPAIAEPTAKQLFGAVKVPTAGRSLPLGFYSKGCLSGGEALPESGPTWQVMRLSRNRYYGMPDLIDYIEQLSARYARATGAGIYVGDMAQPRGGPMLGGHASHQTGLDVDIWLLPATRLNLSRADREKIGAPDYSARRGAYTNAGWTRANEELVHQAALDPRVERIFLFPGGKVALCKDARGNRDWLRKVRPWYGHTEHIHVRLTCPPGVGCAPQDPVPPGDGCDEAQTWVNNIIHPPPPTKPAKPSPPRRELVLADLPAQCTNVISAR